MPESQGLGDAEQVEKKEDWDDSQDGLLSCFCLVVLRDKMNRGPCYPVYSDMDSRSDRSEKTGGPVHLTWKNWVGLQTKLRGKKKYSVSETQILNES